MTANKIIRHTRFNGMWLVCLMLLSLLYTLTATAQNTYLQGRLYLAMNGSNTKFVSNTFYQTDSRSSLYMYDSASIYILSDSIVSLGTWRQDPNTQMIITPSLNTTDRVHHMTFNSSERATFRNISFQGVTSTGSQGLLLKEKNARHTLQIGGTLNMPPVPIFLGSIPRSDVSDYIQDTGLYLILRITDSIKYNNLTSSNFIVTPVRSAMEQSVGVNENARFPIGYDPSYFTPAEVDNSSIKTFYRVTASRNLYEWDESFKSEQDTVTLSNIRPAHANVMWKVECDNPNTFANVFLQIPNNEELIQRAYTPQNAIVSRYIGAPNNEEGTQISKTYWDNAASPMNAVHSVFPEILAVEESNTLLRNIINNFNQYNIFALSSFRSDDMYPLGVVKDAIKWTSGKLQDSIFNQKSLLWTLEEIPATVNNFEIALASDSQFEQDFYMLGSQAKSNGLNYQFVISNSTPNYSNINDFYFRIRPVPSGALDSALYRYEDFIINPSDGFRNSSSSSVIVMNNPISLTNGGSISLLITPKVDETVTKVTISLLSATALESVIFIETITRDNLSNGNLRFDINPLSHGLYAGHYVIASQIEYEQSPSEKVFTRFSIY